MCDSCYDAINFYALPLTIKLSPHYLDSLTAAAEFNGPLSKLIYEFKYKNARGMSHWAADFLRYTTVIPVCNVITAVPLHPHRQRDRGFNQAEEIATHLSPLMNIPYQPLLLRTQNTVSQASLSDKFERLDNLSSSFEILVPAAEFSDSVLIIDDVTTTGTTLNECAKVLKAHGYLQVHGLVLAHGK